MSYELLQNLADQLEDENPRVRLWAVRRLGALADPSAIPALSNVYRNEEETPAVRKAAAEALGVFRAMQEALARNENVEIPDPATVKEPRFSPETLKQLLGILTVLMVLLWVVNAVVAVLAPAGGGTPVAAGPSSDDLRVELERRYAQTNADVQNQRLAWMQLAATGQLKCDLPAPVSTTLPALLIDFNSFPLLYQANLALAEAATRLTLPANNWLLGCNRRELTPPAEENLALVDQAAQQVVQARAWLDQVAANAPFVNPTAPSDTQPTAPPAGEETAETTPPPADALSAATPLALSIETYRTYILDMRSRVDNMMSGRGTVTLLTQYWADVRTTGQSFGCSQPFNVQELTDYNAVGADVAALEPRLMEIQSRLNIGFALTRDSLANFQQGCTTRDFSILLSVGEQRIQGAANAFNQAAQLLDQLQADVTRSGS